MPNGHTTIVDYNRPLTPEQAQMVEDNHGLIGSYAYHYGLDLEEEYGLLALGLIRGVQAWYQNKETHKYQFSTIACWHMKSMVCNTRRGHSRHNVYTVSLDEPIFSNSDNRTRGRDDFSHFLTDEKVIEDFENILTTIDNEYQIRTIHRILSALPDDLGYVARGLLEGKTQMVLAAEMNTSQTSIMRRLQKIRKILPEILKEAI